MRPNATQKGFTLLAALIAIAVMGAGAAAFGELASHAARREKERELLFIGGQFRQAIGSYYERSPGPVKRFPQTLEDLLEDRRYPMVQRHLRKAYVDPMTGKPHWGFIRAPDGGIMGVHSPSDELPIKTGGFAHRDRTLTAMVRYSDWHFSYVPPNPP